MGGGRSAGMIRTTLTAMPRRTSAFAAKAAMLVGVATVAGAISVGGSILVGRIALPSSGFTVTHGLRRCPSKMGLRRVPPSAPCSDDRRPDSRLGAHWNTSRFGRYESVDPERRPSDGEEKLDRVHVTQVSTRAWRV